MMMVTSFDWRTLFAPNESPYFGMFRAGCMGVPLLEITAYLESLGLPPVRAKDVRSWQDGNWKHRLQVAKQSNSVLNPVLKPKHLQRVPILESKLSDFHCFEPDWCESTRRWFPCNEEGKPLDRWGYAEDYTPALYDRATAISLSPRGWVGQNMYLQPFIVIDIDGVGHGHVDYEVINFGNRYRNTTETWENPMKPGSFHLYFNTQHIIPISHFSYAKLDLMGNQKNAAVYTKDKQPNGLPRAMLTEDIWEDLKRYLNTRKQQRDNGRR